MHGGSPYWPCPSATWSFDAGHWIWTLTSRLFPTI
jgi:hypothetical protein